MVMQFERLSGRNVITMAKRPRGAKIELFALLRKVFDLQCVSKLLTLAELGTK